METRQSVGPRDRRLLLAPTSQAEVRLGFILQPQRLCLVPSSLSHLPDGFLGAPYGSARPWALRRAGETSRCPPPLEELRVKTLQDIEEAEAELEITQLSKSQFRVQMLWGRRIDCPWFLHGPLGAVLWGHHRHSVLRNCGIQEMADGFPLGH